MLSPEVMDRRIAQIPSTSVRSDCSNLAVNRQDTHIPIIISDCRRNAGSWLGSNVALWRNSQQGWAFFKVSLDVGQNVHWAFLSRFGIPYWGIYMIDILYTYTEVDTS